jgi:hypothetical protein
MERVYPTMDKTKERGARMNNILPIKFDDGELLEAGVDTQQQAQENIREITKSKEKIIDAYYSERCLKKKVKP